MAEARGVLPFFFLSPIDGSPEHKSPCKISAMKYVTCDVRQNHGPLLLSIITCYQTKVPLMNNHMFYDHTLGDLQLFAEPDPDDLPLVAEPDPDDLLPVAEPTPDNRIPVAEQDPDNPYLLQNQTMDNPYLLQNQTLTTPYHTLMTFYLLQS
jgi:hypothetical protein